mmetsp:Transcript_15996/g.45997  ORF Transcript_15996/g.45997 Transcript_15996/m.45997 type:complete len:234 (+) Transcript_15996:728-1429(+)
MALLVALRFLPVATHFLILELGLLPVRAMNLPHALHSDVGKRSKRPSKDICPICAPVVSIRRRRERRAESRPQLGGVLQRYVGPLPQGGSHGVRGVPDQHSRGCHAAAVLLPHPSGGGGGARPILQQIHIMNGIGVHRRRRDSFQQRPHRLRIVLEQFGGPPFRAFRTTSRRRDRPVRLLRRYGRRDGEYAVGRLPHYESLPGFAARPGVCDAPRRAREVPQPPVVVDNRVGV